MAAKTDKPLAARRGRRVSLLILTGIASIFIAISTWELGRQALGYESTYPTVSHACALALEGFEQAVDRNVMVQMQLDGVERQCVAAGDEEAVVAARRLGEAASFQRQDSVANLARFRRAVDMRIGH